MSDNLPFPPGIPDLPPVPTEIGDRRWTFYFPANGTPRADYSVDILDQYGARMRSMHGTLFEVGGADHLRAEDKAALIAMDDHLLVKAQVAWIVEGE